MAQLRSRKLDHFKITWRLVSAEQTVTATEYENNVCACSSKISILLMFLLQLHADVCVFVKFPPAVLSDKTYFVQVLFGLVCHQ